MVIESLLTSGFLRNIEVKTNFSPQDPMIFAAPDLIKQVQVNLILNSVHALESSREKRLEVGTKVEKGKGEVIFWVEDTGCGIEKDKLDEIFEPYFSTKGSEGTGIGLWIVKLIIENHGGEIRVESEPGKGTKFEIILPLYSPRKTKAST